MKTLVLVIAFAMVIGTGEVRAQGTPVFSNLPATMPANVPSLGVQAYSMPELGDQVRLEANTPRRAGSVTVLMSNWAEWSSYPSLPSGGFLHAITLNIYRNAAQAAAHTPVRTLTQTFLIPWKPAHDPSCPGAAWKSPIDGLCYNGFAFTITFDVRPWNYNLPEKFIYGIAYNTESRGYNPLNVAGPYNSLNVGFNATSGPTVGVDVNSDALYWNTSIASWYTDGGAGGVGVFREDTGWTPYVPSVKFSTFAVPENADDCRNGAWQNLVRKDFSMFQNQTECLAYARKRHDRDDRDDHHNDWK